MKIFVLKPLVLGKEVHYLEMQNDAWVQGECLTLTARGPSLYVRIWRLLTSNYDV